MGEKDLRKLLANLRPSLSEGKYYFASLPESSLFRIAAHLRHVLCVFREQEGITVVFGEALTGMVEALAGGEIKGPFALISLRAESDLLAVGLLAAVSRALADEGIALNAFSAYHHDHLLVPYAQMEKALAALERLQKKA